MRWMRHQSELCHNAMIALANNAVLRCAVLLGFTLVSAADVSLAQSQPELEVQITPSWQAARETALDKLFEELKSAPNEDEAERIANKIYARFRQSGSDTLDTLAARAQSAMGKGDAPVAIEIMSRVIALQPDWAEAWNLRATAFFISGDHARAQADIVETLAREPRQIGALTGLALIFERQGRKQNALKTYRQVLSLAPQLKPVKSAAERLAKDIEQPM